MYITPIWQVITFFMYKFLLGLFFSKVPFRFKLFCSYPAGFCIIFYVWLLFCDVTVLLCDLFPVLYSAFTWRLILFSLKKLFELFQHLGLEYYLSDVVNTHTDCWVNVYRYVWKENLYPCYGWPSCGAVKNILACSK